MPKMSSGIFFIKDGSGILNLIQGGSFIVEVAVLSPAFPSRQPQPDAMTTTSGFYVSPLKRLEKPRRRRHDDEEVILAGRGSTPV